MSTFKKLIWNLTDFEFLASLSSVDFHNKTCYVKPHYYNKLIGMIKANVDIKTKRDLFTVINYIKTLYKQRLGLVSPHSMNRFFRDEIRVSFRAFQHRLEKFFEQPREQPKNVKLTDEEKKQKRKRNRKAAKLRRNQRKSAVPSTPPTPQAEVSDDEPESQPIPNTISESSDLADVRRSPSVDLSPEPSVRSVSPVDSVDEEKERYKILVDELENRENWDLFCAAFGDEMLSTTSDRLIYESFLDWESRAATIAGYESD